MVINALKNTSAQYKLNKGWCLLYSGKQGQKLGKKIHNLQYFKKTRGKRETMDEVSTCFRNKVHIHSVYQDGNLVHDVKIEKMLEKYA
jgi:hypothetical protein